MTPDEEEEEEISMEEAKDELCQLKGVGPSKAENLYENGFRFLEDVESASKEKIQEVKGIGPALSEMIFDSLDEEVEEEADEEVEMVEIFVMGKRYEVPKGLTIMTALEYAGYKFTRGCGCRGGFCGACSTVFRTKDEYKLRMDLACQTAVEDGMFLVQLPFMPAVREDYDIDEVDPEEHDNVLLDHYPEVARCVSCNTCTKACPQDIEVMDYVQAALRGNIERTAELSFDCIQCGLCSIRCPADIKHYHMAQMARRIHAKYNQPESDELAKRVEEIKEGKYDDEMEELVNMEKEALKKRYDERDIKEEG